MSGWQVVCRDWERLENENKPPVFRLAARVAHSSRCDTQSAFDGVLFLNKPPVLIPTSRVAHSSSWCDTQAVFSYVVF